MGAGWRVKCGTKGKGGKEWVFFLNRAGHQNSKRMDVALGNCGWWLEVVGRRTHRHVF